jgi:acetyltransferase-like isoleucine patch superfamily enzyme
VKTENGYIQTGLRKFGAILGDNAEIGCNSVLNPGTVIGRESIIYPLSSVRGFIPERRILKNQGELTERK